MSTRWPRPMITHSRLLPRAPAAHVGWVSSSWIKLERSPEASTPPAKFPFNQVSNERALGSELWSSWSLTAGIAGGFCAFWHSAFGARAAHGHAIETAQEIRGSPETRHDLLSLASE